MSSQARKRFVVPTNNGLAEMFSALEKKDGDVQVFIRSTLNFEAGSSQPIDHEKYSIHRSPNSSGTTITKTLNTASSLRLAAYIKDSSIDLCYLFHARACTDVRHEKYQLKLREKDKLIEIASGPHDDYSLFFFLFAQRKTGVLQEVEGFRLHVEEFQYFNLGIYTTYVDIPASPVGYIMDQTTSSAQIDGKPVSLSQRVEAVSLPLEEVPGKVIYFCANIAEVHLLRIAYLSASDALKEKLFARMKDRSPFLITSVPSNAMAVNAEHVVLPYPDTDEGLAYGPWAIGYMENVCDDTPFREQKF